MVFIVSDSALLVGRNFCGGAEELMMVLTRGRDLRCGRIEARAARVILHVILAIYDARTYLITLWTSSLVSRPGRDTHQTLPARQQATPVHQPQDREPAPHDYRDNQRPSRRASSATIASPSALLSSRDGKSSLWL